MAALDPPNLQRELSDEGRTLLQEALDTQGAPSLRAEDKEADTVQVCVRIRPTANKSAARSPLRLGAHEGGQGGRRTVKVDLPATGQLNFPVHAAFDQDATQADVAGFMVDKAVDKVLAGINGA